MATATTTVTCDTTCPAEDKEVYERIVLEASPDMEKEIQEAKDFLDFAMCRVPDETAEKYEEVDYDEDLGNIQRKTDGIKPKNFPYTFYLIDKEHEEAFDQPIFKDYKGPVYWNDSSRDFIIDPTQPKENFQPENMHKLKYHSLAPRLVYVGDKEKPVTPRRLCEGVAALGFQPGDHCVLENIDVQMREIDGKEVVTIVFYAGEEEED